MPAGTVTCAPSATTSRCARARTASGVPAPSSRSRRAGCRCRRSSGTAPTAQRVGAGRPDLGRAAVTDSLEARSTTSTGAPTRTSTEATIAKTRTPRRWTAASGAGRWAGSGGGAFRARANVVDAGDGRRRGERRAAAGELGEHGALELRAALRDVEEVAALERQQPHAREGAQRRGQALFADERQLADEVPRPEVRGERAAAGRVADELELALEDDEEPSGRAVRARDLRARAVVLARRDAGELVEDRRRDVREAAVRPPARLRPRRPSAPRPARRRPAARSRAGGTGRRPRAAPRACPARRSGRRRARRCGRSRRST